MDERGQTDADAGRQNFPTAADYRAQLRAYVSSEELRALAEPSIKQTIANLAAQWLSMIALFAIAHTVPGLSAPWDWVIGIAVAFGIATRIAALSAVIHEASHGLLCRSSLANDRLCNFASAHWIWHSVEEFRPTHESHHTNLRTADDPDRSFYEIAPGRFSLAALVIRDVLGITAVQRIAALTQYRSKFGRSEQAPDRVRRLCWKAAFQLLILGQFSVVQGPQTGLFLYVAFWVIPMLSIYPLWLRVKTTTEHYHPALLPDAAQFFVSRTSHSNPVADFLFGVHMQYHFEHHLVPGIPHHGLVKLHHLLCQRGFFENGFFDVPSEIDSSASDSSAARQTALSGGYGRFWRRLPEFRTDTRVPVFGSGTRAAALGRESS